MLLAADVGGTNARLALYTDDGLTQLRTHVYPSHDHPSFEAVARRFLDEGTEEGTIGAAVIGVAGPVVDGRVHATNLPWQLDERAIAASLSIARVRLVNDLVSLAYGALHFPAKDLLLLHGTTPPRTRGRNLAVIAAGTGLGEALLVWDADHERHIAVATEGGHSDFAPRNALEVELLSFLAARVGGRVSYERALSGPGLGNLYDFFREVKGIGDDDAVTAAIASASDRNKEIAKRGLDGSSKPSVHALELFVSLYGAEAGNLALKSLATGGVLVTGGIAATLSPVLAKYGFVSAFRDKGRLSKILEETPVAVVNDPKIGLAGSARHAASLLAAPRR